ARGSKSDVPCPGFRPIARRVLPRLPRARSAVPRRCIPGSPREQNTPPGPSVSVCRTDSRISISHICTVACLEFAFPFTIMCVLMPQPRLEELLDPRATALVTQECQGGVIGAETGLPAIAEEARREAIP